MIFFVPELTAANFFILLRSCLSTKKLIGLKLRPELMILLRVKAYARQDVRANASSILTKKNRRYNPISKEVKKRSLTLKSDH